MKAFLQVALLLAFIVMIGAIMLRLLPFHSPLSL